MDSTKTSKLFSRLSISTETSQKTAAAPSELRVVGESVPLVDAVDKVSGTAQFGSDVNLPGMIYGKVIRSPVAHGKILSVDFSRAKKLRGIRAVLTREDVPRTKFGRFVQDESIFPEKARFFGEPIGAIAGDDPEVLEEAADLVSVDVEPLPEVLDIWEAVKPGAPLVHDDYPNNIAYTFNVYRGNVEEGFKEADVIIEDDYCTTLQYQAYLEPMAAVAHWTSSGVTIYAAVQVPAITADYCSDLLGLPRSKVRIIQTFIGGSFGAKVEARIYVIAALLSRAASRPVRLVYDRNEDFLGGLPRLPMHLKLKMGVTKEGIITAKELVVYADNGAYTDHGPAILQTACYRHDTLYRYRNVRATGYLVYTNKVPTGPFRGFGNPQGHFAVESHIDKLAEAIGMDPIELRLKNSTRPGDVTVHGWKVKSCGLPECLIKVREASNWDEKRKQQKSACSTSSGFTELSDEFVDPSGGSGGNEGMERSDGFTGLTRCGVGDESGDTNALQPVKESAGACVYRGLGVAAGIHVAGNRVVFKHFDGSAAWVRIDARGKITVFCGEVDMGQGMRTAYAQIAAEELGVAVKDLTVVQPDTDFTPFGLGTYASRGTFLGGNAVRAAARDAKNKLLSFASELLELSPDMVEVRDGWFYDKNDLSLKVSFQEVASEACYRNAGAPIIGVGFFKPDVEFPDETKYGNISGAYSFAVQAAEVEVNVRTGQVRVVRVTAAHDVGKAINPMSVEGQIQGGVVQGSGYALTEAMLWDSSGCIVNPSFLGYAVPTSLDSPDVIPLIVESNDPSGPFGAKSTGEMAMVPTAAAIANAIYNAVGVRINSLPITPESVLQALKQKF